MRRPQPLPRSGRYRTTRCRRRDRRWIQSARFARPASTWSFVPVSGSRYTCSDVEVLRIRTVCTGSSPSGSSMASSPVTAVAWFAAQGITIERILTDNGNGYRSNLWQQRCAELGIIHTRTKPYRSATNGKAALQPDSHRGVGLRPNPEPEAARARAPDRFVHHYTHHRHRTAIGGPPSSRVTNLAGQNT